MRTFSFILLMVGVTACHKQYQPADPYPIYLISEKEWIVYEGVLPFDDSLYTVELKLKPGSIGEYSYFQLGTSSTRTDLGNILVWHGRDTYQVLYGSQNKRVIQLRIQHIVFKGKNKKPDTIVKEIFFQVVNDHELVLLDADLEIADPGYKLFRRSDLFTVEGYFTIADDTSDFYERNTRRKWAVAKLGFYNEAESNYKKLATEKYEGIYIKALGYAVNQIDDNGNEIDALVFKTILKMGLSEEKEN